jgi:hypothetical protein
MPQGGRLRSMGVCGLEPTDPPPQEIEEEMKRAPLRREGRFLRFARPAARLIETFGTAYNQTFGALKPCAYAFHDKLSNS